MTIDTRIGSTIAGYRIERALGRGGMSVVYLAEDTRLGRKVALKVLSSELAEDQRFRDRFIRESRLAASLEHPNIVPIHEAGEANGVLFIAMRYVRGTDLKALLEEGPLELDRTVSLIEQVARALDAAHAEGLIHRDVKPGNILVVPSSESDREHVYLSDFGLTKRASSDSGMTGTGQFLGTVDYAAPEQFEAKPLDHRADVYSLGCVLYECLVGEPPFAREREVAVMYAHLNERAPRPSTKRPGLTSKVDPVVAKALAKKPADRQPSAGNLASAARIAFGTDASPRAPSPVRRRSLALLGAAGVGLVAILVTALLLVAQRSSRNPSGQATSSSGRIPFPIGLVAVNPRSAKVVRKIAGIGTPGSNLPPVVAAGEGAVWTVDGPNVVHVDPRSLRRTSIPLEIHVGALAVGEGAVWAAHSGAGGGGYSLARISPATDQIQAKIDFECGKARPALGCTSFSGTSGMVAPLGAVWIGDRAGKLLRVDPGDNRVVDEISIGNTVDGLAYGDGSVWAIDNLGGKVVRIDARTGHIQRKIPMLGNLAAIAFGFHAAWVVDSVGGTVTPVDARTDRHESPIHVGNNPTAVAIGFGSVWVANQTDETLSRVNPITEESVAIPIGGHATSLVADPVSGDLWVAIFKQPQIG
jgi:serine/threonine protein kinase